MISRPICETRMMYENTVCFTGHRVLNGNEIRQARVWLRKIIEECYHAGYRWFMCGGALGFDTLAAEEVIRFRSHSSVPHPDIGLFLAIPCENQSLHWSAADRSRYITILNAANQTQILAASYYDGCMHMRNRFMVEHASLCVCYLRQFSGGTGYTVRYALSLDRKVLNLYHSDSAAHFKESPWNYMFTSLSALKNVRTVRSIPFRIAAGNKWNNIFPSSSGKSLFVKKK